MAEDSLLHVAAESDSDSGYEKYDVRRDHTIDSCVRVCKLPWAGGPFPPCRHPDVAHYVVKLSKAVGAEQQGVKITMSFKNMLVPKPKTITQYEQQFVELSFPAYLCSPYRVDKQSTSVKLSSNVVSSHQRLS
jgi:hypothetical protein